MESFTKGQLVIFGVVCVIVILIVGGITGLIPIFKSDSSDPNFPKGPVKLSVWGVGDEYQALVAALGEYQKINPVGAQIRIEYKKFDSVDEYETALLNAFADNKTPDIFMIRNVDAFRYKNKIVAAPSTLITPTNVRQVFPSVVARDFVYSDLETGKESVIALPLHMDVLGVVYNKDLFNSAALVYPPRTWDEFVSFSNKLRTHNTQSNAITIAGTALGTTNNVKNIPDILSALMIQSGSPMYDEKLGRFSFNSDAIKSLSFYLQFSNPLNTYYTWNSEFPTSREVFASGQVGMILDYYSALADIQTRNAFISTAIAPLPQLSTQAANIKNYASYWGVAVSNRSTYSYPAWHFITSLTTNATVNDSYLTATKKLPALLSLIQKSLTGPYGDFVKTFLTATSWRQGDAHKADTILQTMVQDVLTGRTDAAKALQSAQQELNLLY